jgi:hypothetical protein
LYLNLSATSDLPVASMRIDDRSQMRPTVFTTG